MDDHADPGDPGDPTLDAEQLLSAYAHGCFPMADGPTGEVSWYRPDPRGIIPLDGFRVPKSLRRRVRSARFRITLDGCFDRVIRECAQPRSEENGTWMSDSLREVYLDLHRLGFAHSVEAWLGQELVGGLYGVTLGSAFFGESMFSRPGSGGTDASKVCLVHLVEHLRARGATLLDTQFVNPHLLQFGALEVPDRVYASMLGRALADATRLEGPWKE